MFLMCTAEIWIPSSCKITIQFLTFEIKISMLLSFVKLLFVSFSVNTASCLSLKRTVASDSISPSVLAEGAWGTIGALLISGVEDFFLRDLNENLALGVNSALFRSSVSLNSFSCYIKAINGRHVDKKALMTYKRELPFVIGRYKCGSLRQPLLKIVDLLQNIVKAVWELCFRQCFQIG